jgi:hypothetical protein
MGDAWGAYRIKMAAFSHQLFSRHIDDVVGASVIAGQSHR